MKVAEILPFTPPFSLTQFAQVTESQDLFSNRAKILPYAVLG